MPSGRSLEIIDQSRKGLRPLPPFRAAPHSVVWSLVLASCRLVLSTLRRFPHALSPVRTEGKPLSSSLRVGWLVRAGVMAGVVVLAAGAGAAHAGSNGMNSVPH